MNLGNLVLRPSFHCTARQMQRLEPCYVSKAPTGWSCCLCTPTNPGSMQLNATTFANLTTCNALVRQLGTHQAHQVRARHRVTNAGNTALVFPSQTATAEPACFGWNLCALEKRPSICAEVSIEVLHHAHDQVCLVQQRICILLRLTGLVSAAVWLSVCRHVGGVGVRGLV